MIDIQRAGFARNEYRKTPALIDTTLKAADPLSTEMTFQTLLAQEADALAFRSEILNLRKLGRNEWKVSVKSGKYNFKIGDTITIVYPRFGFDNGKNFIIKGITQTLGLMTPLTLYGPQ